MFKAGEIPEDKFKSYRLTRGVYGQRQLGVQMFRLKLPMGRITPAQIVRVADMADKYTNGNLHFTTRQNILQAKKIVPLLFYTILVLFQESKMNKEDSRW